MNKKQKSIFVFLGMSIILIISIIFISIMNIQNRLYDKSKPNIFEIPGTAYQYEVSKIKYYNYYFMVQQYPHNDHEIQSLIDEFIKSNSEIISSEFVNSSSSVRLHFMKPSIDFPVYFEENKNYYIMDDYVDHYESTNQIVGVVFDEKNNAGRYIFYDNY